MRDDDVNLPWQYVLLGFFTFGALFAVMILVASFIPKQFHDRDLGWIRAVTVMNAIRLSITRAVLCL